MILAALALALAAQEADLEKRLDRIVERFREDDIEARDAAGRELEALGPAAVPSMVRRAERAEAEIKARLLGAAREIERKERIAGYLGRPSRITLKSEGRPLRDLLAELGKHSPIAIEGKSVDLDRPVAVELKEASFFEAVDRICRAHGAAVPLLENHYYFDESNPMKIELVKGDASALRRRVEGAFQVELRGVSHSSDGEIGGAREEGSSLTFDVAWETGARPLRVSVEVTSAVDGEGNALEVLPAEEIEEDGLFAGVQQQFEIAFKQPLPAKVRAFREISGRAKFQFPGDAHVAVVEKPLGKKDVEAAGPAGFVLRSCERQGRSVRVVFDAPEAGDDLREATRYSLVDAKGRAVPVPMQEGRGEGGARMTWTARAELPDGFEPVEFRAVKFEVAQIRRIERTVEFKFSDVRFR